MKFMLACLIAWPAAAQPVITSVVNAATLQPGIAPGSLFTIFGTGLSSQTASATFAWPTSLAGSSVLVCQSAAQCLPAGLLYVSPTQINAYAPTAASAVSVSSSGASSVSFSVLPTVYCPTACTVLPYVVAPGVFTEGYDDPIDPSWLIIAQAAYQDYPWLFPYIPATQKQPIRGAITDGRGKLVNSGNPARIGQPYTLWLTGLNDTDQQLDYPGSLSVALMDIPIPGYRYPISSYADVLYLGGSPQYPGLEQINFTIPDYILGSSSGNGYPPSPCGTYRIETTLGTSVKVVKYSLSGTPVTVASGVSNLIQLPILILPGDVPCVN